jgi:acetyl-CoA C-acetyltransferase
LSIDGVVIAAASRTPFGAFGGALRDVTIPKLAAATIGETLRRAGAEAADVDLLVLGVNLPGSDRSLARQAQLEAGIPDDRVSFTVDRACCSGLTAVSRGRQALLCGEADVVVAGGAENLSLVPYYVHDMRWGKRLGPITLSDQLVIACPYTHVPRAVQAAEEAAEFGIDRGQQDEWALRSQQLAARAAEQGLLAQEIVPLDGLAADESLRPQTTLAALERLQTVNGSSTVTAGNAPGLSTGAASALLMRHETASARSIEPLARVVTTAMASGAPRKIASMPAVAAQRVLAQAGIQLTDVALIEVNEAFAAVPLVTTAVLADATGESVEALRERTNVNGGAVALGHPTGATGVRMLLTIALELRRRGGGYGLVTICGGIGEAEAVLIEA